MTEADIRAYLYYGYVPRVNSEDPFWILENWDRGEAKSRLENLSCHELIAEGARALHSAMQAALDGLGGSQHQHVVLLSGGWDSRAVLGGLLDRFGSAEISAATLGLPGCPDFDLARRVTKSIGLRHELIDARDTPCTTELLTRCMKQTDPTPYLPILNGPYLAYVLRSQLGTKITYWNGFLGDALSGARLPAGMPHPWDVSTRLFARSNRWGGVERPGL